MYFFKNNLNYFVPRVATENTINWTNTKISLIYKPENEKSIIPRYMQKHSLNKIIHI